MNSDLFWFVLVPLSLIVISYLSLRFHTVIQGKKEDS